MRAVARVAHVSLEEMGRSGGVRRGRHLVHEAGRVNGLVMQLLAADLVVKQDGRID